MKTSVFSRLALAVFAAAVALLGFGCGTTQHSLSGPIPPNWYDSYYYKDGSLVVPNVPNSYSPAGPQYQ